MEINKALRHIRKSYDSGLLANDNRSICQLLRQYNVLYPNIVLGYAQNWCKWSGIRLYPVPNPKEGWSSILVYAAAKETHTMWTGKYGALRVELLDYLIEVTSEKLPTNAETASNRSCAAQGTDGTATSVPAA